MNKEISTPHAPGYFHDVDQSAETLKYHIRDIAVLGVLFVAAVVFMTGVRMEPTQSIFDWSRIPVTALIVGPVVAASILIANHFSRKSIDRMVTNRKAEHTKKLEDIASTTDGVIVDYSGPEPRLAREAIA